MPSALTNYFPQVFLWFKAKDTLGFGDFLTRWPTLRQAQQARKTPLEAFFHAHHVRYPQVSAERLPALKHAPPLPTDNGVLLPKPLLVQTLVEQLRVPWQGMERVDSAINTGAQPLPDDALFRRLPGAGPTLAPRLLAAFGEQRDRSPRAAALPKLCRPCPGHRAEWAKILGPLAPPMADLPPANPCRMGGGIPPAFLLGGALLSTPTPKGGLPPGRLTRLSL